jgi:hypothetical protein
MIQKPYAAFGHVLIENTYSDGEISTAVINNDITCYTFWVQGLFKNKDITKNTPIQDFAPGQFFRPRLDYVQGIYEHTSVGETKIFCFEERINSNADVDLDSFILTAGSQTTLPKDTRLFLCAGNLAIKDRSITKPTQISISSGDTLVTATTDCYGLLFK